MNEAVASLNSEVHLTIAIEAVELTPETIRVAPVSPSECAKAKTDPEKIPEMDKGNKILLKVVRGLAPSVLEAISKVVSIDRNLVARVRTIYGNVRATWTMNTMRGTFRSGITASRGINPEFNPKIPPIPATVAHVIRVAKPKPDVGITRGSVMMSSKRLFPRNFFLARTYARGIPKIRSKATVNRESRNEKNSTFCICLQFSSPIIGFANTS